MNAIVTGSFDPITLGHVEIIKKASIFFDKIYVVALLNDNKEYLFSLEQKKELMRLSLSEINNVVIDAYDGLTADYMHTHSITKIVRGVRNAQDEQYEKKLSEVMKSYDPNFDTIIINSNDNFREISSTCVREALKNNCDFSKLVHESAVERMKEMYIKNTEKF